MKVGIMILSFNLFFSFGFCQLWKQYTDTAKVFFDKKDPETAIEFFRKANLILAKDSLFTDAYLKNCRAIGDLYFSRGMYVQAEPFYVEVRKMVEKLYGKNSGLYASNADTLGQVYFSNDPAKAALFFTEAKDIREKIFTKNSKEYAASCNSLGNLYTSLGENEKAVSVLSEAKEIREKIYGKNDPAYAQSCNNLANVYWKMNDYENAELLALEAKRIREKIVPVKQHRSYAITCTMLGNIYRDIGQYTKAEDLYKEAMNIRSNFPPVKQNLEYASACNILADLYLYMGESKKAELLYIEAKDIRENQLSKNNIVYAESCNNLANLYRGMGQFKKAESLLLEAKGIFASTLSNEHSSITINLNSLGELYFEMGDFAKAKSVFLQVRKAWEKNLGKNHPYYYQNSANLARVYWNMNEPAKADMLYRESFNSEYEQVNKIFRFTNETEKQQYISNINASSDEYQSFYNQKADHNKSEYPYTISLLNRNLILTSAEKMRSIIYNSHDTGLYKKYESWVTVKQQLAKLYTLQNAGKDEIKQLENDADELEKELTRSSAIFKNAQKKIDWKDVRRSLKDDEAAIEFIEFKNFNGRRFTDTSYCVALLLRKNLLQPKSVLLFETRQLDELLKYTNRSERITGLYSRGVTDDDNTTTSQSIYDLVWKPLEASLKGIRKIYYAPAGNLFKVSFAALPLTPGKVLSDKYKLIQLNSTASITHDSKYVFLQKDKIQLYGGINYDVDSVILKQTINKQLTNSRSFRSAAGDGTMGNGFEYLPGTLQEVNQIKKLAEKSKANVSLLSGNDATEETFDQLNGKNSPAILQIATHGFFFADHDSAQANKNSGATGKVFKQSVNPLIRSGLIFSGANYAWKGNAVTGIRDGILTAYEISNMYLPDTKLVVLSACKTALGDIKGNEGVYGLQRAFKMAGVQNLVMSLWEVPDAETSEFMQAFYKNIFNLQAVDEAFYHAQTTMKNKYRKDPYKWAAWILVR